MSRTTIPAITRPDSTSLTARSTVPRDVAATATHPGCALNGSATTRSDSLSSVVVMERIEVRPCRSCAAVSRSVSPESGVAPRRWPEESKTWSLT